YNYHYHGGDNEDPSVRSDTLNLYPKSEKEIALKEDGAYILAGSVNPYNGFDWDIECHDFVAVKDGKLSFSRHGMHYDGSLHYFGEDTQYERFHNVLKISYLFPDENGEQKQYVLRFHIVDENTVLIKSTADKVEKFAFVKNVPFTGGHGASYTSSDSDIYEVRYYEDGEFRDKWFNKQTDFLVNTHERGTYYVYGNLLVCVWESASMNYYIGTIEEQTAGSECDYLYHYKVIEWNDTCGEKVTTDRIWKETT
ncbi:MAG: hypothetical protein K2N18_00120, partial [Clostridia bacterium]|nr:hypothetical protein [Clostridia bacterium]